MLALLAFFFKKIPDLPGEDSVTGKQQSERQSHEKVCHVA